MNDDQSIIDEQREEIILLGSQLYSSIFYALGIAIDGSKRNELSS